MPLAKDGAYIICDDYGLDVTRFNRTVLDTPKPGVDLFVKEQHGHVEELFSELQYGFRWWK